MLKVVVSVANQINCAKSEGKSVNNTKCPKYRAIKMFINYYNFDVSALTGLKIGAYCDEVNEQRYCATGLVCHQCGGEKDFKCVRCMLT